MGMFPKGSSLRARNVSANVRYGGGGTSGLVPPFRPVLPGEAGGMFANSCRFCQIRYL
jgi:hypothetical protein